VIGKFSLLPSLPNENNKEFWFLSFVSFSISCRSSVLNEVISISPNVCRVEPEEIGCESIEWLVISSESGVFSSIADKSRHRCDFLNFQKKK
jgi:hypothetical protein